MQNKRASELVCVTEEEVIGENVNEPKEKNNDRKLSSFKSCVCSRYAIKLKSVFSLYPQNLNRLLGIYS